MLIYSGRSSLAGKLELRRSSRLFHMAFKLPSLKLKKRVQSSPALQDLPTFKWSDLSDKEEIGRGSFGSVFVAKYAPTSKDTGGGEGIGGLVVIKKLLGTEKEDKRLFLKEAKILHGLKSTNVVQFKAFCEKPSAIMLEHVCFDFAPFGLQEIAYSLDDYLHFINACDHFKEFPFQNKIAQDICSGIIYYKL